MTRRPKPRSDTLENEVRLVLRELRDQKFIDTYPDGSEFGQDLLGATEFLLPLEKPRVVPLNEMRVIVQAIKKDDRADDILAATLTRTTAHEALYLTQKAQRLAPLARGHISPLEHAAILRANVELRRTHPGIGKMKRAMMLSERFGREADTIRKLLPSQPRGRPPKK
ncbi:hypothetical protein NOV72_03280 [Caballeronia novacaledonica]|uniref:Uncharacterized protein n=1 Tax=Caballeronia novacaledonica TaxID=1544861 RepID=A0A2U3I7C4_9BURK|nr:hypothetical protein [Caballeronia novacaledonica]SPB16080.1 hypothetical protein NOV72_03280 [Caballeronia novacaledonica]